MVMSKTQRLVEDLKALIRSEARLKAGLPPPKPRDEIQASRGKGLAAVVKASAQGGLAFPLTEDGSKRVLYASRYLYDTSGLFAFAWAPYNKTYYTDAAGNSGYVIHADPEA